MSTVYVPNLKNPWMNCEDLFFKTITHSDLLYLRIPRHFVEKHMHTIPSQLCLSTSEGKSWKVVLSSDNVGLKINGGWIPFRDHNKLELGDVVVLFYVKFGHFFVKCLDAVTGMEKRPPTRAVYNPSTSDVNIIPSMICSAREETVGRKGQDVHGSKRVHPVFAAMHKRGGPVTKKIKEDNAFNWHTYVNVDANHMQHGLVIPTAWAKSQLCIGRHARILRFKDHSACPSTHCFNVICVVEEDQCCIQDGWEVFATKWDVKENDLITLDILDPDKLTWEVNLYRK